MFSFFGGIDFSGAKEPLSNLWSAIGREDDGKLRIVSLRPHAYRADLCSYVAVGWRDGVGRDDDKILWGGGFPFGLPAAAVPAMSMRSGGPDSWRDTLAWVADRPADEVRDTIPPDSHQPRATDAPGTPGPLDNRVYKVAVEGMRWLHQLQDESDVAVHPQAPDPTSSTTLIEVSSPITAHEVGFPRRRSPARPGEFRARAAALRTLVRFSDPCYEAAAVNLEDAWDATIACVSAWLARDDLDQPFRVAGVAREIVEIEGWTYRPPASVI
ncbi:MAG TPA: hypothetical protein VFI91_02990 [Longimicrobiaceae bacterium]|nr:hypothetical protein [Longimicrobiaceae bacterium]